MNKEMNQQQFENVEYQYRNIFDTIRDGLLINDLESGLVVAANPEACLMHGYSHEEFIGLQLKAFIYPDSLHLFNEFIRDFQSDGVFDQQVVHVRRDGSKFFGSWRGIAFTYQGRPCLLGCIRDITKRVEAEKVLNQHIEKRTYEQAKLLEISQTLASMLEFQPGVILDKLREIVEYSRGGLFSLEDSTLTALAMRGTPQMEQSPHIRIHLQGPETLAILFNGHRPIRIPDILSDDPEAQFLRSLLDDGAAVLLEGMRSWMWVPLAVRGRIIGGLGIAEGRKNHFTSHQADLALGVANQAAITMVNAELYGHAQVLAVMEERQRLARNLHDAVNQSLFSAGLIAEVLPRLWERDQEDARRSLNDLVRLTRGAQAEMRALLAELRPSTLSDSNLGDLIRLLGNALSGRTNIPVAISVKEEIILPSAIQEAFYHVCQEALYNVAKHSKASQVEIYLKQDGPVTELFIRDDGQGFDCKQTFLGHYGLSMMRERADAVGAEFSVKSRPGSGTELTLRWSSTPIKEPA